MLKKYLDFAISENISYSVYCHIIKGPKNNLNVYFDCNLTLSIQISSIIIARLISIRRQFIIKSHINILFHSSYIQCIKRRQTVLCVWGYLLSIPSFCDMNCSLVCKYSCLGVINKGMLLCSFILINAILLHRLCLLFFTRQSKQKHWIESEKCHSCNKLLKHHKNS